jgi:ribosomal protein S27AE
MTPVADAIRTVTAKVQQAIDDGYRSRSIDADDLVEVLLAIADELDPPLADLVDPALACPNCGERRTDRLMMDDDELVHCGRCGANYRSGE